NTPARSDQAAHPAVVVRPAAELQVREVGVQLFSHRTSGTIAHGQVEVTGLELTDRGDHSRSAAGEHLGDGAVCHALLHLSERDRPFVHLPAVVGDDLQDGPAGDTLQDGAGQLRVVHGTVTGDQEHVHPAELFEVG